jgi:uncharacterized iron-regulated protein
MAPPQLLCSLLLLVLGNCAWVELNMPLPALENLLAVKDKKPTLQSPLLQQHHLVGRIWRPADGRFVEQKTLAKDLARSTYILLGETHDNPDHHLLQARLIRVLASLGRRPAVVWEMIPETQQPILDRYWANYSQDAAALGATLSWDASGWPSWRLYQPIAEAAMAARLPMYAAGLSKTVMRALARGKPPFGFTKRRRALGLHIPFPEALRQRSLEQLYQSHCELMPREALEPLLNAQQSKDAVFAKHMLASGVDDGSLLIAGAGHVRKDLAVPLFLARHQPGARVASVAFLEVQDGVLDPTDYAADFLSPALPFDYVWFTPRADDQDHCGELKKNWRHLKDTKIDTTKAPAAPPSPAEKPAPTISNPPATKELAPAAAKS